MGDRHVRVLRGRHRAARGWVLDCKRTMVQSVPVLRGFAGDHTDLVSPFVMLDSSVTKD